MNWLVLPLILSLSNAGSFSASEMPAKYLLRLKLETGALPAWTLDTRNTMEMALPTSSEPLKMEMNSQAGLLLGVLSSNRKEGNYHVSIVVDSTNLYMSGVPGMDVQYHSSQLKEGELQENQVLQKMQALMESRIIAVLANSGEIMELRGISALNERLGADGSSAGMSNNPFENLQSFFPVYPKNKIGIGSEWQVITEQQHNEIPSSVTYTYVLNEVVNKRARIGLKAVIHMPETDIDQEGTIIRFGLNGVQSGEVWVSLDSGFPESAKLDQTLDLNMTTSGFSMPIFVRGTVELQTIKR